VGDAIGFSKDGGNTYGTAMSAELGIVADYITTGTLRAIIVDGVEIYGSLFYSESTTNSNDYMKIEGGYLESHGIHLRDWLGGKENNQILLKMENGQIRARNEDKDWSLYFNDNGISTYSDGDGNQFDKTASGVIEFHSERYTYGGALGLTIMSGSRLALETLNESAIFLNPGSSSVIIGDDNDNFSKLRADQVYTNAIRQHPDGIGGKHLYIGISGTEGAEARVTNLEMASVTDIGYRPIRSSSFKEASHSSLKENIQPLTETACNVIQNLEVIEYNYKNDNERYIGFRAEESEPL